MKTRIYSPTPTNLRRLSAALQRGELVAIPTETVYGLAAPALNDRACRAIFKAKGRPAHDPLIVHVLDLAHADELAEFNETARRVARKFWPGPLTLVLPKKECVPDIVTSNRNTVAIRSPSHPLARRLLQLSGVPLAAPSANLFGYISPTTAAHVLDGLRGRIAHVLDGGACRVGVESTILDLTVPQHPKILRPGAITVTELEKYLGVKVAIGAPGRTAASSKLGMRAPGLLARHYSPRTPLVIKTAWQDQPPDVGGIFLRRPTGISPRQVYWLSERASLQEVARNLYQILRRADRAGHRQLWIESLPESSGGLATAINDRLRRAANRQG